jgi:CheY-like chemotaxis protein/anti-sigma regulatory factor (Ser/Thr protein kinase)
VDLAALVHAAVESIRPSAESRQLTIDATGLDQRRQTLGDPDRLQQVIWNLLSNAVKFTPAGGRVSVALSRAGDRDTLAVADTGIGIEPAFLAHVFDTFRQADASSTRQHGGLGLGLSIARRLVELHGGEIAAVSDGAGRGSTFTVRLPVRASSPVDPPSRPVAREPAPARDGRLAGRTILVVDDEPDALDMLVSVLENAGATVVPARSADEALRAAVEQHPQVLVSDVGMPGTDGYALLRQIRATLGPDALPVTIAVTAYAGERDREQSAAAGYQRHLSKPLDPLKLVDIVVEMLTPRHVTGRIPGDIIE